MTSSIAPAVTFFDTQLARLAPPVLPPQLFLVVPVFALVIATVAGGFVFAAVLDRLLRWAGWIGPADRVRRWERFVIVFAASFLVASVSERLLVRVGWITPPKRFCAFPVPSFLFAAVVAPLSHRAGWPWPRDVMRRRDRFWILFVASLFAAGLLDQVLVWAGRLPPVTRLPTFVVASLLSAAFVALFAAPVGRRERFWIKLLFCGAAMRAVTILVWRGPMDLLYSDAMRHYDNAKHFLDPGPQGCSNPYFYQQFLYRMLQWTHEDKLWIHLVSVTLSVGYPLCWYGFARTWLRRRVDALRFATVLAFLPTHTVMFSFFMNESLLFPLLGGALWATSVAGKRRSGKHFVLAVLLWSLCVLTRSVVLPASVIALGWSLWRMRRSVVEPLVAVPLFAAAVYLAQSYVAPVWYAYGHGPGARPGVTLAEVRDVVVIFLRAALGYTAQASKGGVAVGVLAVVALGFGFYRLRGRLVPLVLGAAITMAALGIAAEHSYKHLQRYTPFGDNAIVSIYFASGMSGYQVNYMYGGTYIFGSPSLYISPFEPFYEWKSVRWKSKEPYRFTVDPKKHGEDVKEILWGLVKKNKSLLPRLVFENMLFTSFSHSWPDSGKESGPAIACLWERWIWFPLFFASLSNCLFVIKRRRRLAFVPVMAIVMITGLYASQITVMEGRYRKPIEPMVVLSLFWLAT